MSHRSSSYDGHFDHYHHISQTSHSVFSGNVSWVPITRRSGTCWEWSCCSSFWLACVKLTFSIFVGHFVFDQFHFYQICFHRFEGCHLQVGRQQELSQVSRRNLGYFFVDTYYINSFIFHCTSYYRRIFLIVEKMCCIHMVYLSYTANKICKMSTCPFMFHVPTNIRIVRFGSCLQHLVVINHFDNLNCYRITKSLLY